MIFTLLCTVPVSVINGNNNKSLFCVEGASMALEQKCCTGEQRVGMEVEALKAKAWDDKEGSGMVNWN